MAFPLLFGHGIEFPHLQCCFALGNLQYRVGQIHHKCHKTFFALNQVSMETPQGPFDKRKNHVRRIATLCGNASLESTFCTVS